MLLEVLFAFGLQLREVHFALLQLDVVVEDDHLLDQRELLADATDLRKLLLRHKDDLHIGMRKAEQQVVVLLQLD